MALSRQGLGLVEQPPGLVEQPPQQLRSQAKVCGTLVNHHLTGQAHGSGHALYVRRAGISVTTNRALSAEKDQRV